MTLPHEDDTTLDALSAQARAFPELPMEEVAILLEKARDAPHGSAEERLIEHHLGVALDSALAHRGHGLEIGDLYQEATFAVMVAVTEYAARAGRAAGLRAYIEKVVGTHLETAIADEKAARATEEEMVHAAERLAVVDLRLRQQLGREASEDEVALELEWPVAQVITVRTMLRAARELADEDISQYLDEDDEPEPLD